MSSLSFSNHLTFQDKPHGMSHCSFCGKAGELLPCSCGKVSYCGPACQKSGWPLHRLACPLVACRSVEGRGLALLATRRIRPGRRLVLEEPLLTFAGKDMNLFLETFAKLASEKKLLFLSLYDPGPASDSKKEDGAEKLEKLIKDSFSDQDGLLIMKGLQAWRILWVNGVSVGQLGEEKIKAVYPTVSRINHSCGANAVFGLVGETLTMAITAIQEIAKGEEVTLNYIGTEGLLASQLERRRQLERSWGFRCSCRVCGLEAEDLARNERQRKELRGYKEEVARWVKPDVESVTKALEISLRRMDTMREMGMEVVAALPYALVEAYGQAKAVWWWGGEPVMSPGCLLEEATSLAAILGPSVQRLVREAREEVDIVIEGWRQ